jgi:hypothetical protein
VASPIFFPARRDAVEREKKDRIKINNKNHTTQSHQTVKLSMRRVCISGGPLRNSFVSPAGNQITQPRMLQILKEVGWDAVHGCTRQDMVIVTPDSAPRASNMQLGKAAPGAKGKKWAEWLSGLAPRDQTEIRDALDRFDASLGGQGRPAPQRRRRAPRFEQQQQQQEEEESAYAVAPSPSINNNVPAPRKRAPFRRRRVQPTSFAAASPSQQFADEEESSQRLDAGYDDDVAASHDQDTGVDVDDTFGAANDDDDDFIHRLVQNKIRPLELAQFFIATVPRLKATRLTRLLVANPELLPAWKTVAASLVAAAAS